jgi:hypothetical protein
LTLFAGCHGTTKIQNAAEMKDARVAAIPAGTSVREAKSQLVAREFAGSQ